MTVSSTGVKGLDVVLGGGLSPGSLVVVTGPPGTGKTILAQQICFHNATPQHPALYYTTLSEPHTKLVRHLEPFSFFDRDALEQRVEFLHIAELLAEGPDAGLVPTAEEILRRVFEHNPSVVVIDSSKALHGFADAASLRRVLYDLASKVAHNSAVLVLVGEYTPGEIDSLPEFAVADTIIQLASEAHGPVDRLRLRVVKVRGQAPLKGQHSFAIGADGIEVFPRLESTLPARGVTVFERVAVGVPRLDEMLGGGLPRGDATLVLGPSGVGKTVMALQFMARGLANGESGLYLSFQENTEQLVTKAAAMGWDLAGPLRSGQLRILAVPPVELDLDAVGTVVSEAMLAGEIRRVIVDSLAELAYAARQSERLPAYIWSLAATTSAYGASSLVTSETATLGPLAELAGGVSFLFHNIVLMRFYQAESRIARALTILKMRDSRHETSHVQFDIGDHGIEVGPVLEGLSGVLGFTALTTDSEPAPPGDIPGV